MNRLKILVSYPDRCTECRRCELWCSLMHFNKQSPKLAAVHVVKQVPVVCTQCGLCMTVCPVEGALKRIRKTGAIKVTEKCIGCGQCVTACPTGMITLNTEVKKAVKCDLCDGDPACVKHCFYDALGFVPINQGAEMRRINSVHIQKKQ